jgi:hypothetical protein
MSDSPMRRFLNRKPVKKEGEFSPRHRDNSDEIYDEESQASDKFHCTSAKSDTEKARLYNESYIWALHGLVIQVVLSIAPCLWQTTYKCSNGSSKTEKTLNYKSQPHD